MKWIRICSAVVMTLGLTTAVQANTMTLTNGASCGGQVKSCGCAPTCQPVCCKPTIEIPCETNVYTYQRQRSSLKPPCCQTCPAPVCCQPACSPKKSCGLLSGKGCGLFSGKGCGLFGCKKNDCCPPASTCNTCAAPAPTCQTCQAAPACQSCQPAPCCCEKKGCGLFGGKGCGLLSGKKGCGLFSGKGCGLFSGKKGCGLFGSKGWGLFGCKQKKGICTITETRTVCCPVDPCELAEIIYRSQTACYADDRESAIEELGETYSCLCNPEIMVALIYALNDAVEDVREEAAEQIGKQLEDNPCCCTPEVISALTCALGDCDKGVVKAATKALEACGYCVQEANCCVCAHAPVCNSGCATGNCPVNGGYGVPAGIPVAPPHAPEALPMPEGEAAPAPAPPEDPKAYYPSQLRQKQAQVKGSKNRLANLFGLLN